MQDLLDMPDLALLGDQSPENFTPSSKTPSTTPSENGPSTTPSKKRPPTTSSEKRPLITLSEKGPPNTSIKESNIMKLLDKKQFKTQDLWPPIRPIDNVQSSTPFWKWSHQKIPTVSPFANLPPIKPIDLEIPKYKFKFVFVEATQPPFAKAIHSGTIFLKVIGGAVGFFLTLVLLSKLADKKNRTRREVVLATDAGAAEQNLQADSRTPSAPGEPGLPNNDLPPSYYECTLYSMNEYVNEVPPPYTNSEDHKQRQDSFVENERRACSEDIAPEMRTELVFNNGRITERQSLDPNSNNNKTGVISNDNVEK